MSDTIELLHEIRKDINRIKEKLAEVDEKCDKMSNHINFVEGIYERIKRPFNYVITMVETKLISDE
jgi:hypothetical protein